MAFIGSTPTTQSFTPTIDYFSGNGSSTAFTLSRPVASVAQVQVTIDNVVQNPSTAFSVSGNTITFTSAPLSGTNNIYVYYTSPITQLVAPSQGTVYPTSLSVSNALYWDTSGNIGIGTTSPGAKLDVMGTSRYTFNVANSYTLLTSVNAAVSAFVDSYYNANQHIWQGSGTERMRIDSSGNVGINNTSPNYKLSVNSSNGINSYDGVSGKGRFVLGDPLDPTGYVGMYRSVASTIGTAGNDLTIGCLSTIAFTTGGTSFSTQTERMRIDSSGNLLIGTTSVIQSGKLSVSGIISAQNSGASYSANQVNATGDQFYFRTSSGANLAGYITCPSATTTQYLSISDYRLKENIAPIMGALNKISMLKPVTYTWKVDGTEGQGFIAHELQEVIPDCVSEKKDAVDENGNPKYQGVDTSFLVATLTAAIQEQQTIINDLKARVTALEGASL